MDITERKNRLVGRLEASREELMSILNRVQPEDAVNSTENPLWTVHDIVAHLAISEIGLQATVKRFLEGIDLPAEFSLDYWNERQVNKAHARQTADLIAGLQASRDQTLALLEGLTEQQLDAEGLHPAGIQTNIEGVFKIMAYHERLHGSEIARALGLPAANVRPWPAGSTE